MKEKTKMKKTAILSRLLPYLLQYRLLLLACILLTVGGNLLALAGPYVSGLAIDAMELGTGRVDFSSVGFYSALMVLLYIASAVLSYALTRLMIVISRRVVNTMRRDVFNKLTELPVGYFDTNQTGDILSRISYDIDTINTSLSNDLVQVFASVVTVVGALAMMLAISPVLVLVFAVTVPLSFVLTKKITGFTRPLFRRRSAKLGELNGFVEEMISGQKTLRAYSQEENTIEKLDRQNDETVEAYYKADYYGSLVGPLGQFRQQSFAFARQLLRRGAVSRRFDLHRQYLVFRAVFAQVQRPDQRGREHYRRAAVGLFGGGARVPPARRAARAGRRAGRRRPQGCGRRGRALHVSFGYTPDRQIIKDLSLRVPKGALVAIVGPTGAGKTTIINLLMRFYDVDSGEIRLDGCPVRGLTRRSLRLNYSMVLQDTWLFSGTVFENIAYGSETATRADVERVCRACGIHEYIMTLPRAMTPCSTTTARTSRRARSS